MVLLLIMVAAIKVLLFFLAVNHIQKNDMEHGIQLNKKIIISVSVSFIITTFALYLKFAFTLYFLFYCILMTILVTESIIDLQTKNVYRWMNNVGIGLIFVFTLQNSDDIAKILTRLVIYILFVIVLVKLNLYGNGDGYVFVMTALFLGMINQNLIEVGILNIVITILLHCLIYIKNISFKKKLMKKTYPFVPSIALATFLMIVIL